MNMYTEEEFNRYKGDDEFLEVRYYANWSEEHIIIQHKTYQEYVDYYNQQQLQNTYNKNLDSLAYDIRQELKNKIESSVWDNQKCFIELWKKENPNIEMNDIVMYHSFDESGNYKFWVEMKEKSE